MADSSLQPAEHLATDLAVCYEVKLYLATLMHQLKVGDILEFISSDSHAEQEVTEWVALRGYTLLTVEQTDEARTRFLIQR